MEIVVQILGIVSGIVASAASARWGHKAIMDRLQSYVTVAEYREKTAALHAEINELKTRLALHEDRETRK